MTSTPPSKHGPAPHVSNDGPLLLWLLLNHFHSSTITYAAQLSDTIRNRSLQEHHNHDVESYIIWLQQHLNTLQSIDPTSLADKATTEAIFRQLLSTTWPALQRIVEEWYIEYHSKTLPLDPIVHSNKTSKRIHILKTVGKLNDTATNPKIMALKAHIDAYANTATSALNAISRKLTTTKPPPHLQSQRPSWFHQPPTDTNHTHEHDGRTWHWCPRCNAANGGRWVCTHTAATHRDSFTPKKRQFDDNDNKVEQHSSTKKQHITATTQAAAYLSGLSDLLPEDTSNDTQPYQDEILDW
jgi:hypothetical protein